MQCLAKGSDCGDREDEMNESMTKAESTGLEHCSVRWHGG